LNEWEVYDHGEEEGQEGQGQEEEGRQEEVIAVTVVRSAHP
jgi:hypothetical protein